MEKEPGKEFEILWGCADVVKAEKEREGEDVVEKMRSINAALSAKIARGYTRLSAFSLSLSLDNISRKYPRVKPVVGTFLSVAIENRVNKSAYPRSRISGRKSFAEQTFGRTSG